MTAPRPLRTGIVLLSTVAAAACGGGARATADAPTPKRTDTDLAALEALYREAGPANPMSSRIHDLVEMANATVRDLRGYTRGGGHQQHHPQRGRH